VPASGGGYKAEPELDLLSNIVKSFNDQWGNIAWADEDRIQRLIAEDIPARVSADMAYQNAMRNNDKQNARIEHDKALARVVTGMVKDDTHCSSSSATTSHSVSGYPKPCSQSPMKSQGSGRHSIYLAQLPPLARKIAALAETSLECRT
jgi:hypothetical protein